MTLPPSSTLDAAALEALTGRRIRVAGHFVDPVTLDGVEDLGDAVSIRVRAPDGGLHETVLDLEELADGTEMPERSIGQGTASLASSIFLVARRRDSDVTGAYHEVLGELDGVIAERLDRLTRAGVVGSDLVIAAIGAGLAPFTRYAEVELPSGEPVAAERFLEEVQTRVLAAVLAGLGPVDSATRYYVLVRTMFGWADVEFDEANNLAKSAGVELKNGLAHGPLRLADVSGKSVHMRDYAERGADPQLGQDGGRLVDVLHGLLWRASHAAHDVAPYLDATRPDPERLRQVAQALQGKALRGESESKPAEAQACERLLGAWGRLVEDNLLRSRA